MTSFTPRFSAISAIALSIFLLAPASSVLAQGFTPAPPPVNAAPGSANPVCQRLEAQLTSIDRGGVDPAKADQIRRYEDASARQQGELDRVTAQASRAGCDSSGFFSLFNGQNDKCAPLNNQIQQMRTNLQQITSNLERLRGSQGTDRDLQRRSVTVALAQNNCGPQYANAARGGGGLFESLFSPGNNSNQDNGPPSSTFKTVCVRTCDGFYFPISFATVPSRFGDDEKTCKAQCPAADTALYSHRNPGEDMSQAVSTSGQLYSQSPNAFKYRTEVNNACSCRSAGQSWGEALKGTDDQIEQGDIVVTEESAKQMQQRDANGRPLRPAAGKNAPAGKTAPTAKSAPAAKKAPADTPATAAAPASATPSNDRPIRTVGPAFFPTK